MDLMERYASLLIDYSAPVASGDRVLIRGTPVAEPLLRELYAAVLRRGAEPVLRIAFGWQGPLYYEHASDDVMARSVFEMFDAEHADVLVHVASETNTKSLSGVDPGRVSARSKVLQPVSERIMGRNPDGSEKVRWTSTLYPTDAYAQDAEMSLHEFERFVYASMFLEREDPMRAWKELEATQQSLADLLNRSSEVRILGKDTDLTLGVSGRNAINSAGTHNMPSGEVFTAPLEDAVDGIIRFSEFPQVYQAREVADVTLKFSAGKVIDASAAKNEEFLIAMLDTDSGSRTLGELGIGTNPGIQRSTKRILFDEKIGGSAHFALGRAYDENGGLNKSAIHWDLIKDLREGGRIAFDGVPYAWDGERWTQA